MGHRLQTLRRFRISHYLLSNRVRLFRCRDVLFRRLVKCDPGITGNFRGSLVGGQFVVVGRRCGRHLTKMHGVTLLPLYVNMLTLFSFARGPILIRPMLPVMSIPVGTRAPGIMLPRMAMSGTNGRGSFLLLSAPGVIRCMRSESTRVIRSKTKRPLTRISVFMPGTLSALSTRDSSKAFSRRRGVGRAVSVSLQTSRIMLSHTPHGGGTCIQFVRQSGRSAHIALTVPVRCSER